MQFFSVAILLLFLLVVFASRPVQSGPSMSGQTGLVFMPSARIEDDGVLRFGASNADPYFVLWSSVTLLPRLELSGRFTTIDGLPAFGGTADFRDKAFDAKLLLRRESTYVPSVSVGSQDFLGTRVFDAKFIVFNKRLFSLDVTIGYGQGRIDGAWGGIRYQPSWSKNIALVAEHDANDYRNDIGSMQSGAVRRQGGATYALEYRNGWFGGQLAFQGSEAAINAFISIPLMKREFVPKIDEPAPFSGKRPQPQLYQQPSVKPEDFRGLLQALHYQGFKDIRLSLDGNTLEASLTHTRITQAGRVVGRAARTLLLLGPPEIKSIRIIYTDSDNGLPLFEYRFRNADVLQEYFDGLVSLQQLTSYMSVGYASKRGEKRSGPGSLSMSTLDLPVKALPLPPMYSDEGHVVIFKDEDPFLSRFELIPFNLRLFFNDPSGAYRYDTFSLVNYNKRISDSLFFNSAARLTLLENVSGVTQLSNSLLPHVRSDVAEYKKGDRFRLNTLLLSKYFFPKEHFYGRLSIGYYEEMFAGTGGQLLYLPENSRWAVDLTVDWLRQREYQGGLGFSDYTTVSMLGSVHYRSPFLGLSATVRAGRFLAKDEGVRLQFSRQFRSGVEIGAWYTLTNGNDITGPGNPDDPYQDKGVFASIPLNSLLTWDNRANAKLSISPWTRDVGQMVTSPGDLYLMLERSSVWQENKFSPFTALRD